MFNIPVKELMERRKIAKLAPEATVAQAAKLMAKRSIGAVMIMHDARLVGIITERDVVFRVVSRGLDPRATRISQVMTADPRTIGPNEPFGRALAIMHHEKFRHLPVTDWAKVVGVVSARAAMDPELEEFVSEANRREYFSAGPGVSRRGL